MRLGRLFFAGAVLLGLAWFALRSPLPAVDPRFIKLDVADAGAPLAINAFLASGFPRDRARAELEAAAARLKAAGIGNLMIRFGGNLVVRGRRGDAPWRIGLRNPRGGPDDAVAYLLADRDEAIASFGTAPVVTVLDPDAAAAARQARGLAALGAGWPEAARKQGVAQVLAVDDSGAVRVTPDLAKRLKFLHGIAPTVLP